jgi:hypothetical protein
MASWEKGDGWRITGVVVKDPYINRAGTFAALTIATPGKKGEKKHDVRAFDADLIEEIRGLGIGMTVQVTGGIDNESLKDKAGKDVSVDGWRVWVTKLTARKIEVEGSSRAPAPAGGKPAPNSAEDKGW